MANQTLMKTLTISALLLVAAIITSSFVVSRQGVAKEGVSKVQNVTTFRAHRQGHGIALTWSAAGGVAKFHVERSYDGEYFEVIGEVENTGARTHKFMDENVPPGYMHYRICCMDANDEEQSKSAVEVVRIVQRK